MLCNILKTQFCFLSNRDGNNNSRKDSACKVLVSRIMSLNWLLGARSFESFNK